MANYMQQRKAFISAGFQAGLHAGRQQIMDMLVVVLHDPEIMKKDTFGRERLMLVIDGIGKAIDEYYLAWQKDDETDYYRAKLDAALADAFDVAELQDSFSKRYDTAPEYDYTKGKWKA